MSWINATQRKALIETIRIRRHKWRLRLPEDAPRFYDKRIGFEISPLMLGGKGEPPLTAGERRLIEQILEHFPKLVRKAEKEFWEPLADLDEEELLPHVWINREDHFAGKTSKWTFVVELRGSSYAWHIEFSGLRFKERWAGS